MRDTYYNMDCIAGAKTYIPDAVVDLVITDPPFAIEGDQLHKLYNRNEGHVVEGYVEVSKENYGDFSFRWIEQAKRVLKDTGSMYIVSGWTNLLDVLLAIEQNGLELINHIIWKYNFGVSTKHKFVTSHYHILYCRKKDRAETKFNPYCRFGAAEKDSEGSSMLYCDLEDVWTIGRDFKKGRTKNRNELPVELLRKMILYSSDENDLICDFFLGSFSTAKVARSLGRYSTGFEINGTAYEHQVGQVSNIQRGWMLAGLRLNGGNPYFNQRKRWTKEETGSVMERYHNIKRTGVSDRQAYSILSQEFGRGYFSMMNIVKKSRR